MTSAIVTLALSLLAVGGSLYLSLGLGLAACPLCFYQRTFAFGIVGLLSVGLAVPNRESLPLSLLVLPLAIGGLGVAAFHTNLVATGKLECPLGIGGLGSAPLQSLLIFALITLAVLVGVVGDVRANAKTLPALVLGVVFGGLAVYGSIVANPTPKKGEAPVTDPATLKTCQVPYGQ